MGFDALVVLWLLGDKFHAEVYAVYWIKFDHVDMSGHPWKTRMPLPREVLDKTFNQGDHILDLLSGDGKKSVEIAKRNPHIEIVCDGLPNGFNIFESVLNAERHNAPSDQIRFILGDARNIPYPNSYFDYITVLGAGFTFVSQENLVSIVKEMARVIKLHNGTILIETLERGGENPNEIVSVKEIFRSEGTDIKRIDRRRNSETSYLFTIETGVSSDGQNTSSPVNKQVIVPQFSKKTAKFYVPSFDSGGTKRDSGLIGKDEDGNFTGIVQHSRVPTRRTTMMEFYLDIANRAEEMINWADQRKMPLKRFVTIGQLGTFLPDGSLVREVGVKKAWKDYEDFGDGMVNPAEIVSAILERKGLQEYQVIAGNDSSAWTLFMAKTLKDYIRANKISGIDETKR